MKTGMVILFCISLLICSPGFAAPQESTCVKCHSDAGVLKSLFKPPKLDLGEGEG